ncbi:MAG: MauE/DoxX family redox-associated membrane protein [Candidatus Saccharimonadales bacterium]
MAHTIIKAQSNKREYRKFLAVLVFIFFAATLMSTLIAFRWEDWIRWFIGSSLLVFGGFKLISFDSFLQVFPRYDPLAARFAWYSYVYPIIEVLLGVFFILEIATGLRLVIALVMFGISLLGLITNLDRQGPSTQNTWLGHFLKLPMSTALLFEDAIITFLVVVLIVASFI